MSQTGAARYPAATRVTLPAWGIRALSLQGALLVAASFLLPAAAHLAGLPVRTLLPMHWPVILVGLVYGWRSGAVVGAAAPVLSHVVSGMPAALVLPAMTVELATYGLLAGLFRERLRMNAFVAAGLALLGGRAVFLAVAVATGVPGPSTLDYLAVAMVPGLPAALAQLVTLPLLARWWVRRGLAG